MSRQDGYKYEGVAVENLKIDDEPAKAKAIEANGARVKTRRPKSAGLLKVKIVAAVLVSIILLVVVVGLVFVFASRDTVKPVFSNCPTSFTVTVHSSSEAENVSAWWDQPTATDNSASVNLTSTHRPGDAFARSSTTNVTYRAADQSGNVANCSFQVSVVDCEPDEWRCDDGACISDALVCDGTPSCADASDETLCEDCSEEDFLSPCDEGATCVPVSFLCDGVQHCDDFEDERYCDDCEANGYLPCRYGNQCFRYSDACNNVIDCPRFKDEYNCYECASIPMDQCQSRLPYNVTFFPGHFKTAEESIDYFMDFGQIMDCHGELELFLCSYLFPECGKDGGPRYLCADFCREVQEACEAPYADAHEGRELNFFCERYPRAATGDAEAKLCRSSFEGCTIGKTTEVDISDGRHYDLLSPNYPMSYPSAFDCLWMFQAAPGKYIVFVLLDMVMSDDNLFVGPGPEVDLSDPTFYFTEDVRYGRWLLNVTVPSDVAYVKMVAGPANAARGFWFDVMQVEAANETCADDEFLCDVGGCFPKTRICDGYPDCYDETDELKCDVCPYYDQVRCGDGSCIHRFAVCDNYPDCDNDEDNCTFACGYSSVYLNDLLVCDSFNDCSNHADELQNCACVEGRQYDCGERCIPINYLCDDTFDCADGSDEINCTCSNWKRPCDDGICLPFWLFCDNTPDCNDGSDEKDCPACSGNYYTCDNLECISADGICDGYFDCSDRTDEAYCEGVHFECPADSFRCVSEKQCVPPHGVCDSVVNCIGGEDEADCDKVILEQSEACGERNIELTAASPNFTLSFPAVASLPVQCTWLITAPASTRITVIKLEDFPTGDKLRVGHGHDPFDTANDLETFDIPQDKALVSQANTMWVAFETELAFLTFEIFFASIEKVCPGDERQCLSKYTECIVSTSWCDQKEDCPTGTDEQQCLRLENQGVDAPRREGIVKVTIEGDEKYLCYDEQTWSEAVGDVVCNEYGYGYVNDTSFEDVATVGTIEDGFYMLPKKEIQKLLAPGPKPKLYEVVTKHDTCLSGKIIRISCEIQECGRQGHMPRVVNGRDAVPGEVPWMVSLSHPRGDNVDHFCGGALLTNKWVITAGHCVRGFVTPKILAGSTNLTADVGYEQVRQVKRAIPFPNYINYNDNDVALLELEVPVSISDRVMPVCLPPRNDSALTAVGSSATMAGWGGTVPFSMTPHVLQTARATIIDTDSCKNFEDLSYVSDKVLCCMNQYGEQNSCKGDSGGPLYSNSGGKWYQIGLVSRGGVPSCSSPRQVVVYTRLSKFLDFIEKYVKSE